jgi:hypothetical protein
VESRRGPEERRKLSSNEQIGATEERDLKSIEYLEEHSKPIGTRFVTKGNLEEFQAEFAKAIGASFVSKTNHENFQTGELIGGQIQPTEKVEFGEAIGNRHDGKEEEQAV